MNVCVVTDNVHIYKRFLGIIDSDIYKQHCFYFYSSNRMLPIDNGYKTPEIINFKKKNEQFFSKYDLFISLHSKQIFPESLVDNHICINIHPGYNPYNRGWYPHIFSIINKMPTGITIHRMDAEVDHGPILFQKEITIDEYDTSFDVYRKLLDLETAMLKMYLPVILAGKYTETPMCDKGNVNSKVDFYNLCKIDLDKQASYGEVIDYLRAMTFENYKNAYFFDKKGNKVYVSIKFDVLKE